MGGALSRLHVSRIGKRVFRQIAFAIHSMLVGSAPSVPINSFTAFHAISKGMNRPTGNEVPCMPHTNSPRRLEMAALHAQELLQEHDPRRAPTEH
jgi:hypothetical protein